MRNIDEMPPKCHNCPYWEVCKYPYVCSDMKGEAMTKEEALKAFEQMLSEIDKDNWLFVGTINPQMVEWAIKALKGADDETD